jgi:molybdopterin converting factor small subunit
MATVSIPSLLADTTRGDRQAEVAGETLGEVISALEALYPGIQARLCKGGKISSFVALTVDGKIAAAGLQTRLRPDSRVDILPAFGGG